MDERQVCEFCGKKIPKNQKPLYQKNKKTGEQKIMCQHCFAIVNNMEYSEFQRRKKYFTMGVYGLIICLVAMIVLLHTVMA